MKEKNCISKWRKKQQKIRIDFRLARKDQRTRVLDRLVEVIRSLQSSLMSSLKNRFKFNSKTLITTDQPRVASKSFLSSKLNTTIKLNSSSMSNNKTASSTQEMALRPLASALAWTPRTTLWDPWVASRILILAFQTIWLERVPRREFRCRPILFW